MEENIILRFNNGEFVFASKITKFRIDKTGNKPLFCYNLVGLTDEFTIELDSEESKIIETRLDRLFTIRTFGQ